MSSGDTEPSGTPVIRCRGGSEWCDYHFHLEDAGEIFGPRTGKTWDGKTLDEYGFPLWIHDNPHPDKCPNCKRGRLI